MDPDTKKLWTIAGTTGAVGLEIAVAIGIGYLGGQYLDHKLGVAPWLTWVGFAAGVLLGAAVYNNSLKHQLSARPGNVSPSVIQ